MYLALFLRGLHWIPPASSVWSHPVGGVGALGTFASNLVPSSLFLPGRESAPKSADAFSEMGVPRFGLWEGGCRGGDASGFCGR